MLSNEIAEISLGKGKFEYWVAKILRPLDGNVVQTRHDFVMDIIALAQE